MGSYFIGGMWFAELNLIPSEQLRVYFEKRIDEHKAFSYRGDWYAHYDNLDKGGKLFCPQAVAKLSETGVDLRSIPKVDPTLLAQYGTLAQHRRIICAFNSISKNGRLDCEEAARQFAVYHGSDGVSLNPVSFLRKLNEIPQEVEAAWRLHLNEDHIDGSLLDGKPAYVRWDGKPLKRQSPEGDNGQAGEKGTEEESDGDDLLY